MNNDRSILVNGISHVDQTDYERLDAMTEAEITAQALADPDAQPLSTQDLLRGQRMADLPGNTVLEKLQHFAHQNKKLVSVRYDADVIAFFKSKGKGYQRLMNTALRDYMNRELGISA